MGKISPDGVVVWWYRGPRTPLPAVFYGSFAIAHETVVLTGRFQHRIADRLLLTVLVVVLLLFSVASMVGLAIVFYVTLSPMDRLLVAGLLGALMATTAIAVFWSIQPLRQDDISKVSLAIREALNDDPSNSPLQRTVARDARPGR